MRCDIETDPTVVKSILLDVWHMPPPALLMQIAGGHIYLKVRENVQVNFLDELVKFVSQSSENRNRW